MPKHEKLLDLAGLAPRHSLVMAQLSRTSWITLACMLTNSLGQTLE